MGQMKRSAVVCDVLRDIFTNLLAAILTPICYFIFELSYNERTLTQKNRQQVKT